MKIVLIVFGLSVVALSQTVPTPNPGDPLNISPKHFKLTAATATITASTCSVGDLAFATDATAGLNIYECTATNTWTQQSGGASGVTGLTVNPDTSISATVGFDLASCAAPTFTAGGTTTLNFATSNCNKVTFDNLAGTTTYSAPTNTHGFGPLYLVQVTGTSAPASPVTYNAAMTEGAQPFGSGGVITIQEFNYDGTAWRGRAASVSGVAGTFTSGPSSTSPCGTPAAGNLCSWFDSATKNYKVVDETGAVAQTVAAGANLVLTGKILDVNTGTIPTALATQENNWQFVSSVTGTTSYSGSPASGCAASLALTDGMVVWLKVDTATTTTATFNYCTLGAKSIKRSAPGSNDPGTLIQPGMYFPLTYESATTVWRLPHGYSANLLYVTNAGVTGTTQSTITKLTGAPSTAVVAATTDTGGAVGVTVGGAGTTGVAAIQTSGQVLCVFDGATTAGDYVQISSTVAGNCHDSASTYPTSGQVIGRVLSTNAAGGTFYLDLFGAGIQASSASGGSPGGSGTEIQYRGGPTTFNALANSSVPNAGEVLIGTTPSNTATRSIFGLGSAPAGCPTAASSGCYYTTNAATGFVGDFFHYEVNGALRFYGTNTAANSQTFGIGTKDNNGLRFDHADGGLLQLKDGAGSLGSALAGISMNNLVIWNAGGTTLARLNANTTPNNLDTYNQIATAGMGLPPIYAAPAYSSGNAANVTATNLQCGAAICAAGFYRVVVYTDTTNAQSGTGTVQSTIGWTNGAARSSSSTAMPLSAGNNQSFTVYVHTDGTANITFAFSYASTGQYDYNVTLERLN